MIPICDDQENSGAARSQATRQACRGPCTGPQTPGGRVPVLTIGLLLTVLITAAGIPGPRRSQAPAVEHAPRFARGQAQLLWRT